MIMLFRIILLLALITLEEMVLKLWFRLSFKGEAQGLSEYEHTVLERL